MSRSSTTQVAADTIDQLDLALDQLGINDRNFDRFAILLIDNVVELALHRFVQFKAREREYLRRTRPDEPDDKAIARALSQNFDHKAKFAGKVGLIGTDVCESVLNLHAFRNTAYHQGQRHEGILHSLALFYFRNACSVLLAHDPGGGSASSDDKISHRARKYLGAARGLQLIGPGTSLSDAYRRLDEVAASMESDLVGDLSRDMRATIDDIDNTIQFLADESPETKSRTQAILECQAWPFYLSDEAKQFAIAKGFPGGNVHAFVDWLTINFDWPIKVDPIPSWRSRLDTLSRDTDPHKALKRYCDFMKQTEDFRSLVQEAGAQLDGYIQHQIDVARGK